MHLFPTTSHITEAVITAADNAMDQIPRGCGLIQHIPESVVTLDWSGRPCLPIPEPETVGFMRSRAQISDIASESLAYPHVQGIAIMGGYNFWNSLEAAKNGNPYDGKATFQLAVWNRQS